MEVNARLPILWRLEIRPRSLGYDIIPIAVSFTARNNKWLARLSGNCYTYPDRPATCASSDRPIKQKINIEIWRGLTRLLLGREMAAHYCEFLTHYIWRCNNKLPLWLIINIAAININIKLIMEMIVVENQLTCAGSLPLIGPVRVGWVILYGRSW